MKNISLTLFHIVQQPKREKKEKKLSYFYIKIQGKTQYEVYLSEQVPTNFDQ